MQIRLKRYLRLLGATTLYLVVGFLIDEEFGAFYYASALFWLLVSVLEDVVSSRRRINQKTPDVR